MPQNERAEIRGFKCVDEVVISIDQIQLLSKQSK